MKTTATKNGKLNRKKVEPGQREGERTKERVKELFTFPMCVACWNVLYINMYVECVHSIFGTFKIDRCDVFSTRYENRLFDRPQKIPRRAEWWTAHRMVKKRVAVDWVPFRIRAIYRGEKIMRRVGHGLELSNTYIIRDAHIHFVCIEKKYVYEWRNQFGYLELIINSQICIV